MTVAITDLNQDHFQINDTMKNVALFVLIVAFVFASLTALTSVDQGIPATFEVVKEDGSIQSFSFEWPYDGPPPIGSIDSVLSTVQLILEENELDCPPEREKISDNIWKCGNGNKIRTDDQRLKTVFSYSWGE